MNPHKSPLVFVAAASSVLFLIGTSYLSGQATGDGINPAVWLQQLWYSLPLDTAAFWGLFAALFAIMNPLIAVPLFVKVTTHRGARERRRLAALCSTTVLLALLISALIGQQLLDFFAISIEAFRVSGGIIVLLMGLAMMRSEGGSASSARDGEEEGGSSESHAICPLAIPLLAGPGAIATIIVESQSAGSLTELATIGCVIAAIVSLTYLALRLAAPIAKALGPTGLMVATRLIGMIVAAIAIDMMLVGLQQSFPLAF